MEQAYKLYGDVLATHGVTERESLKADNSEHFPSDKLEPEHAVTVAVAV